MADTENGASLLARKDFGRAVPVLKAEHEKYPSNPRIRLQYADALAGAGNVEEAIRQYDATARYYEDNGLTVQAIAVRKKSEKLQAESGPKAVPAPEAKGRSEPLFTEPPVKSPLFEVLSPAEREALIQQMELEQHDEGSVIIAEGQRGASMYVISHGAVKVFTHDALGRPVYLARLGEGDFFGEVSVLSGKPRTATITAAAPTELLRLDKENLDDALAAYPGIRKVLDDFYKKRAKHTVEAMIESMRKKG